MSRIAVNGIELEVAVKGQGPAVLLLHGFTGNMDTWAPFLGAWSEFQLIRVDVIGHGGSDAPADASRYSMDAATTDLIALLDHLGIDRAAVVGYSMGGRLALHLALAAPERLWGVVLEGASPGIADAAERQARIESDNVMADDIGRYGIEAFVDRWQIQPLFATQMYLPPEAFDLQRRQRLACSPVGLANSLRGMGAGRQEYLLPRLKELRLPVMLMAGAKDDRYSGIAWQLADELRDAVVEIVPEAGHAAHLEQPAYFGREVAAFLKRCQARIKQQEKRV